jgi:hypothetical protein
MSFTRRDSLYPAVGETDWAAGRILLAIQAGDLAGLDGELDRSARLRPSSPHCPTAILERLELLRAVVQEMREALHRMRRQRTDRYEGAEVHLRLLQHLAEGTL